MNKVYTIGRDPSCDIVIADPTDVISRVHASLKVTGRGKYILIDQSRNGTYVNGIRMSANEEIPVTRKDTISFAHVRDLDWDQIPKENNLKIWLLAAIVIVVMSIFGYCIFNLKEEPAQPSIKEPDIPAETYKAPVVKDTVYVKLKPVVKPQPKKEKPAEKKEEKPAQEEPEVVNPLL